MNKELSQEEKEENTSALLRDDKKILTLFDFYRPLSIELQDCFGLLFSCEVNAEKPVFVPDPEPSFIPFKKEEGGILKIKNSGLQFLIHLSGLKIKDADKFQDIKGSVFSGLAGILDGMLGLNNTLAVTALTEEAYLEFKWGDGMALMFFIEQKKPFTLTVYPTSTALDRITIRNMFGTDRQHEVSRLKCYDFARPDKFSKEQVKTTSWIHQDFSSRFSSLLSLSLNSTVNVWFSFLDQLSFLDFRKWVDLYAKIGFVSMSPLKGEALLGIDQALYSVVSNRLFGLPSESIEKRDTTTDIEKTVLQNIYGRILDCWAESWKEFFEIQPRLLRIGDSLRYGRAIPETETFLCIEFEVTIDSVKGNINFFLPYSLLQPILGILGSASTSVIPSWKTGVPEKVKQFLLNTSFMRTVRFACVPLQDRKFSALSVKSDSTGRYEYENVSTIYCIEDGQKTVQEYERTERISTFIEKFPMCFEIEFEDQVVDYNSYLAIVKQSSEIALCSCSEKKGALYLGENKITDIVLAKNDIGLSVKSIDDSYGIDELALEGMLLDSSFTVCVEMGETYLPVETVLSLTDGSIISFDSLAGNPLSIFIEQPRYLIGKGEAVVMDNNIGMRMLEIISMGTGLIPDVHAQFNEPAVHVRFILSQTSATLRSIIALETDSVLKLDGMIGETGTLIFDNGFTLEAEVVVVDENFGARIVITEPCDTAIKFDQTLTNSAEEAETISFDVVRNAISADLANCIRQEHPQIIAVILSRLERKKAVAVLKSLPVAIQAEVVKRMKKIGRIPAMVISEIAGVVNNKLKFLGSMNIVKYSKQNESDS